MKKRQGQKTSSSLPLSCFVYAAGHEDEGVCLLLHIGKYRILLDCGLADLSDIIQEKTSVADFAFCSHAHLDHCQGILELHRNFPSLPIYISEVTSKLLPFYWNLDRETENLDWCEILQWRTPVNIAPDLQI